MICFVVPCVPVAQPRPRAFVLKGHARVYAADKKHCVHSFKAAVQLAAEQAYQGPPLECPLRVLLTFVLPRPASMRWKKREMKRAWHTKKPDASNLLKAVEDALNGLLWVDDAQIVMLRAVKVIASGNEKPRVEVEVYEMGAIP